MIETTIPKVIHYCWFGRNPLPPLAEKCIASWRKFLPDYEIKEWNEDNFDVYITTYTEEAYRLKKYAFVSDYARFWILYHYGGIYFDVDVELIKPIDDILARGPFMGLEKMEGSPKGDSIAVAAGLGMAAYPKMTVYGDVLTFYQNQNHISLKGKITGTVVAFITQLMLQMGEINSEEISLCRGVYIYPHSYFDPMNYYTGELTIEENTRSIHHYAATWRAKKRENLFVKHYNRGRNLFTRFYVRVHRAFTA